MKLHDLPVRKKITLANFTMIIIPVLIVIVIMIGILIGILADAGSSVTIAAVDKMSGMVTNYQLQMMLDSVSEDIVENKDAFAAEDSALHEICRELEQMGVRVAITSGAETLYETAGYTAEQIRGETERQDAESAHLFLRTGTKFAYRELLSLRDGSEYSIYAAASGLPYENGEYYSYQQIKDHLKILLVAVFGAAAVIIILTGVWLSKKLSRSILVPLGALSQATAQVRCGNLDSPVRYDSGDEFGQVCKEFDEMRLRLKESVLLQQKYERQRKELVAGISHDLSTPITSIKGYVSGILDGIANTPEKREHYLRTIYDRACDMERMVESLFVYSKLDLEQEPFRLETVELGIYLEESVGELRSGLEAHGMQMDFKNECAEPVLVQLDRFQFGRVLSNLMDNSVKYKKPREEKPKIRLTLTCDGKAAVLRFSDNGIGIDEEEAEKIFESFYRTDPARSNTTKGSGMGLSIARKIIRRMGGEIKAAGRADHGIEITMILPRMENGQ